MIVDASAMVEWLLRTPTGLRVEARVFSSPVELHAPHLIDIEVAQALRRLARAGTVTDARAAEALDDLADLRIVRAAHEVLLARIWQLRQNLTAYDAAYVALAEALNVPLLTCDPKLRSAPNHRARVEVI